MKACVVGLAVFFFAMGAFAQDLSLSYVDLVQAAVDAYSETEIADYVADVEKRGVTEHGFPRLAVNMAYLVSCGRLTEKRELVGKMMTLACREMNRTPHAPAAGNDFSVKELALAVVRAEQTRSYPRELTDAWRASLSSLVASNTYNRGRFTPGSPRADNWLVFAAASEQARLRHGMGGDPAFVERAVADQLRWFDENGMYRDPGCPMVYDGVTRLQFAVILSEGYDGPSRAALEAQMDRSTDLTLQMLSAAGEIPYGGRSNEFFHNGTFYAALSEWYAARLARRGERDKAATFRAAARRAVDSIAWWMKVKPVSHLRNRYPHDSGMGCEGYAYFNKYMVTMGSWAILADLFADAAVPAIEPASRGPAVIRFSPDFHRTLLTAGDYSAELDSAAQAAYDSTGFGRLQRRGAPSTLALSVPCPSNDHYGYQLPTGVNCCPLAFMPIAPGEMVITGCETNGAAVLLKGTRGNLTWQGELSPTGFTLRAQGPGRVTLALPAFTFDGAEKPRHHATDHELTVSYRGWVYRARTPARLIDTGIDCGNRNGIYRRYEAEGEKEVTLTAEIIPAR